MDILTKEIDQNNDLIKKGVTKDIDITPSRHPYAEFCLAQKEYLKSSAFFADLKYWQDTLNPICEILKEDSNPLLEINTASQNSHGAVVQTRIPKNMVFLINSAKKYLQCSTILILYSVFSLLLSQIFNKKK